MKVFTFLTVLALCTLMACQSGQSNKPENTGQDTLAQAAPDTIDDTAEAPVYHDKDTHDIPPVIQHEVLSFYKAIPDKFFPVAGKPDEAVKQVDKTNQYMHLDYGNGASADLKLLRDTDTGREYFLVFSYSPQGAKYYILYLKKKVCIDSSDELLPNLSPAFIKSAATNAKVNAPKQKLFVMSPTLPEFYLVNDLNPSKQVKLTTFKWQYGRFLF